MTSRGQVPGGKRQEAHRRSGRVLLAVALLIAYPYGGAAAQSQPAQAPRVRARELGLAPGIYPTGKLNAITDVTGVKVGQSTILQGDSVRTGVTVVFPHGGNLFRDKVPGAVVIGNAFGKLIGSTQVNELGELETPILLTCTLCVWRAADYMVEWLLEQPGMERVQSINPVVAETNDGGLNAIRSRPVTRDAVRSALTSASTGPVAEGAVGAGAGTSAFGWKAGIGTSSRVLPANNGGYTVGVLVQANFGGQLQMMGAPVGRELRTPAGNPLNQNGDGSIIMVVATDAPLSDRNMKRLADRALLGMGRTGGNSSNGSGDYVIAFSTAESVRRTPDGPRQRTEELRNDDISTLSEAVIEATEEAIYNSLTMATTVTSRGRTTQAIPLDRLREILAKYHVSDR